jgi:putative ABC transport system permease protein
MITNYIKIALRNLLKRRGNTLLNIAGLTIGMTCCLLIFHYVSYERSYDDFHPKGNDIVRLRLDSYKAGELRWKSATVFPAIGPTMKKDFPEVESFCRLVDADFIVTNKATQAKFRETKGYFADQATLQLFNIQLLQGNPANALTGPDKMIISQSMANRYFGKQDAMGQSLKIRYENIFQNYVISGVFKDYPANSHLDIKYLASYDAFKKIYTYNYGDTTNATETGWGWYAYYTYVQLKPGTDRAQFEAKIPAFSDRYINNTERAKKHHFKTEIHTMPLQDIHLQSNFNQEAEVNGNGQAVGFLFLVAIFIIGIAWINYINLATARSAERAREVGVRKVLGALRIDLIGQFVTESFLINLVALGLSLTFFFTLLAPFDLFTGHPSTNISLSPYYWQLFIILFTGGTLISGMYPAFVLSGFQPIKALKGVFKNSISGLVLRKGLIVLQFTTSVVLIAGTIVVYRQVNFMREQKLGANIEQTLVLEGAAMPTQANYTKVFQPFKTAVLQQTGVKGLTASSSVMGQEVYWTNTFKRVGAGEETGNTLFSVGIDQDFIPQFDMKLVTGRNFDNTYAAEGQHGLLNERALAAMGFPNAEAAIGQKIMNGWDTVTIVGVLADYHQQGLQKPIEPMLYRYSPDSRNYYSIKLGTKNLPATIAAIKGRWDVYFPDDPFSYTFLDETFATQYKADILFGKVFGIFSFLAILIACFGLLGLSAYNVIQRTKEIGIRKVLGASAQSILVLLSKDFMKLIVIALVLATPVSWYIMHHWLQDFAYRIDIGWWIFAVAGMLALIIALFTIVLQAARAVTENPINSLRNE